MEGFTVNGTAPAFIYIFMAQYSLTSLKMLKQNIIMAAVSGHTRKGYLRQMIVLCMEEYHVLAFNLAQDHPCFCSPVIYRVNVSFLFLNVFPIIYFLC